MIKIVEGNILDATEDIIGHQVNCQGAMGSGLAEQIRKKYPVVYKDYINICSKKNPYDLLGDVHLVVVGRWKYVANIFGQLNYGRNKKIVYTDYDALFSALKHLKDVSKKANKSIALPYGIGCGLANGDWDKVYNMIDEIFKRYEVTLYKYE